MLLLSEELARAHIRELQRAGASESQRHAHEALLAARHRRRRRQARRASLRSRLALG